MTVDTVYFIDLSNCEQGPAFVSLWKVLHFTLSGDLLFREENVYSKLV